MTMPTLGIFVKWPVPKQVKTRLGAEIGFEQAARLYEAFLLDLFEMTQDIGCQRVIAYSPGIPSIGEKFANLTSEADVLWPQPEMPLGGRLQTFFDDHLTPTNPVVVIGSDSPTLPREYIEMAFRKLIDNSKESEPSDAVLGPSLDGGYYLIGQRTPCQSLFDSIDWSSESVLEQTIDRFVSAERSFELLPPWYDIDSQTDLQFLRGHLKAMAFSKAPCHLPENTVRVVEEILSSVDRSRSESPSS